MTWKAKPNDKGRKSRDSENGLASSKVPELDRILRDWDEDDEQDSTVNIHVHPAVSHESAGPHTISPRAKKVGASIAGVVIALVTAGKILWEVLK